MKDDVIRFKCNGGELQLYKTTDDLAYVCTLIPNEIIFNTNNINIGLKMMKQLLLGRTIREAVEVCIQLYGDDMRCDYYVDDNYVIGGLYG